MSALFVVLNVGNLSNTIVGAKLEAQQEVRRAMEWMIMDLRNTDRMRLQVIDPDVDPVNRIQFNVSTGTITDPLFNICIGYAVSGNLWSSNQIGYTYDAVNRRIVRSDSGTGNTWQFNHINSLTFTKTKTGLNSLLIEIMGQKTAIGTITPTFTLQEEVKLRNE